MSEPEARQKAGFFSSVRARLLAIALVPMLVVMPMFLGAVVLNWSARFDDLLIAKVNGELTIANQYMFTLLDKSASEVEALAGSADFANAVAARDNSALVGLLRERRLELGLDFIYLKMADGTMVSDPEFKGEFDPFRWPVFRAASAGTRAAEIDIFSGEDLAKISDTLAAQARIKLVETKAAVATNRLEERRGMVLHIASPVVFNDITGALVGGVLLNQNLDFIDTINDLVYPSASLTEGSRGTATLFLEDVRVSTNVRLFENVRALGTRVSAIVRTTVLDGGNVWLDRAFVVNDWYISAYEPIVDSFGNRVGMLYVGFLDTPFQAAKMRTLFIVISGFLLISALSVPVFLLWTRSIVMPLENMVTTIGKVEDGDLGARSALVTGQREIARVSTHLDGLLDQLEERDRRLRDWAGELNERVAERTRELEEANQQVEATTKQLVISEKLAAIGEITAGIAHEINNPMAVIQGNLDVIHQETKGDVSDLSTEFGLIYEQVHSVNILVNKLLQFARPEEYAGMVDHHNPNEIINDSIPLVQHLLNKVDIRLELDLQASHCVSMNRTELQQVLINLIVNAIHAMPKGGVLGLVSADHVHDGADGVLIKVIDTGIGMSPEVLKSVFDPFFTTKRREGTGLGLSISQDLVARTGGYIQVESTENVGTKFKIWVPSTEGLEA